MTHAPLTLTLPRWYDLHAHMRQGEFLGPLIQAHIDMGCAGLLAMPNTKPPVAKVLGNDPLPYESVQSYTNALKDAGANVFDALIVPLYLTQDTTPQMIEKGAQAGILRAAKYYPPHGTTGAELSAPFENFMENGVFAALQDHNIVLCIHGEAHSLTSERYFDQNINAEEIFYTHALPDVVARFPRLKIVCEHITTRVAVDFVRAAPAHVGATITPQHLLYTVGHLLQGLKYHLYCLPLLKFEDDRAALRSAVLDPQNTQFFAGTDSAPHTVKTTPCGCAAGCFTGAIAPQLYAQGFEESGLDLSLSENQKIFENFLCHNGRIFYDLPHPTGTFTLVKESQTLTALDTPAGTITPLPLGLGQATIPWRIL